MNLHLFKTLTTLFLAFSIGFSQPVFSHKLHSHGHGHDHSKCNGEHGEIDVTLGPEVPLSEKEVQSLMHSSHEVMEGDESAGFFKRWVSALNFKEKFIDAYRWASTQSKNPRFRDGVNDVLLLYGLSHLIEMNSGPSLLVVGAVNDWPQWVMGAVAAGGTAISIPGLDPLCYLIYITYAKSSKFRSAVGTVRAALMPTVQMGILGTEMYLEDIMSLFVEPKIRKLKGLTRVQTTGDGQATYYFSYVNNSTENPPTIQLEIKKNPDGAFLHSVVIHKNSLVSLDKTAFKEWLQPLGWNAKNLINKALQLTAQEQDLQGAFNKLYIKSVKQGQTSNSIELADHAVVVAEENCEQFLMPSFAPIGAF